MNRANKVISIAQAWLGFNEKDGTYKEIIDVYNSYTPHPRGYTLTYSDAWCAAFVSAVAIKAECTNIIPVECSCYYMMSSFQNLGEWEEDEDRTPAIGDIVFYDWGDSGKGDNTGTPDHVGIVTQVAGTTFTAIEGNKSNSVGYRKLSNNGKYLRGFACPRYDESIKSTTSTSKSGLNKSEQWKGVVIASSLNVRVWAGTKYATCSFSPLPYNTKISVCDAVAAEDGTIWYYIQTDGKYGFVSSKYIQKV